MVVKIMIPFWIPIIIRHLILWVPKKDHNFDNHPYHMGIIYIYIYMGGCQNYGPFLDPYYITAPNILGTQRGP